MNSKHKPKLTRAQRKQLAKAPKLTRQVNTLGWYSELQIFGYSVVSADALQVSNQTIELGGKQVECPPGCVILVNPKFKHGK